MGAEPYWYFVAYEDDKNSALQKLRQREFMAGRYNPVMTNIDFPITKQSPAPGKQHDTIEDVLEDSDEDGTRSILDMNLVSEVNGYCVARILTDDELNNYFGTSKPTREMVENNFVFFNDIERGKGVCITIYKDNHPDELFFSGYSFD